MVVAPTAPAAVYALTKYVEWLKKYAPPEAAGMTFTEAGPVPGQGHIAQQIFWYSAFTKALTKPGLPVVNDGRHAEVAHGPLAARAVLEDRDAERLPGRRFLDADELRAAGAA